jgi:hypothetical protein
MSLRILFALLVKSVGLRLVIIMLVSSPCRTTSTLSLTMADHLRKVRKAMDQVFIPVGHLALFLPILNWSWGDYH